MKASRSKAKSSQLLLEKLSTAGYSTRCRGPEVILLLTAGTAAETKASDEGKEGMLLDVQGNFSTTGNKGLLMRFNYALLQLQLLLHELQFDVTVEATDAMSQSLQSCH